MIVLVCGGRDFNDYKFVERELDKLDLSPEDTIVNGDAKGADKLAQIYAFHHGIKYRNFPAQWNKYGASAGPIRNRQMFDETKPNVVVAFPGGRGTFDMVYYALSKNCLVINFNEGT